MAATSNNVRKVVLITGSSSGIGAATAVEFAKLGYRLSLFALDVPADEVGLVETKNRCLQINSQLTSDDIITMNGDLTREIDCQDLIAKTVEHFKRLDVLVANAGIVRRGTLETTTMEDFDLVMNTNCRSVVYMNQLVIPHLAETKGNIVNVASVAGLQVWANLFAYSLSKAAVVQLTKFGALELATKGIRVNAVCPGMIASTNIIANAGLPIEAYEKNLAMASKAYPLGRPGTPEEVAKSIVYLASEETGSFLTGVNLSIDGGHNVLGSLDGRMLQSN